MNTRFRVVEDTINGHKLITLDDFVSATTLIDLWDSGSLTQRDKYTIELPQGNLIHPTARYINHSCDPSAYIEPISGLVIAIQDIPRYSEITINYLLSESEISQPFNCRCGSQNCIGRISS